MKGQWGLLVAAAFVAVACASSHHPKPIATAYCNACGAQPFTLADCQKFGTTAGCEVIEVDEATIDGCHNSCTFEHCKENVECGGGGHFGGPPSPGPTTCNTSGIYTTQPSCAHAEQYSMSCGTSKQSSPTLSCCMTAPFKRVLSVSLRGSAISSVVTSQGPNEPLA